MNADSNIKKQKIVIITTFDDQEYILYDKTLQQWNDIVDNYKKIWKNKVYLENYDFNLYFSQIKKEKWKTISLSLPKPKEEKPFFLLWSNEKKKILNDNPELYYKLKKEEEEWRKRRAEWLRKLWWITLEKRKKSFLEKREEILKNLAKEEEFFLLETTISKIKALNELRLTNQKNEINKN